MIALQIKNVIADVRNLISNIERLLARIAQVFFSRRYYLYRAVKSYSRN